MTDPQNNQDAYDSPWKAVLEHAFPKFMAFYFPAAYAQIDWAQGHEFKNTELRQVVRDAELGKRFADTLAQVTLTGGEQRWIYIHIEVQGQRDTDFARRMFTYNYRLFDRYASPIVSLAVLADHYGFEVLGCRHTLEFPIVKFIDYADPVESLETSPNPFALVTAAHLRTRQTENDPKAAIGPSSTLCVRCTGEVGTNNVYKYPVSPYFPLSARREAARCEACEHRNSESYFKLAQQRSWPLLAAPGGSPPNVPRRRYSAWQ